MTANTGSSQTGLLSLAKSEPDREYVKRIAAKVAEIHELMDDRSLDDLEDRRRYLNAVATLERLFHDDPRTIRYGAAENLYGMDAIRAFRRARSPVGVERRIGETVITTFGRDFATAMTEFRREGNPLTGRQSQTWVRFPEGWRIVAAHISNLSG